MSDVTLAEAAKSVQKSPVTLRAAVNQGRLKSYLKGRIHYVNLNDVVALFAERSRSDIRAGASSQNNANDALISAYQAQIRQLENERDFLRRQLSLATDNQASMLAELTQRRAEVQAFTEGRPGLFDFFRKK